MPDKLRLIEITIPPKDMTAPVDVHSKLSFLWLADGKIAAPKIKVFDNEAIDAWAVCMMNLCKTWPHDQPLLVLHDATRVRFNPHLREHSEAIVQTCAHLQGAYAFLLPSGGFGQVLRLYLTVSAAVSNSPRDQRAFPVSERDDAIAWLLTYIGDSL